MQKSTKYVIGFVSAGLILMIIFRKQIIKFTKMAIALNINIMKSALEDLGIKETPGTVNNEKIVQYFKDVGYSWVQDDETSWCTAFLGAVLKRAGAIYLKTLRARDYLNYPNAVTSPKKGDIAIFSRTSDPVYGHVGFYISETQDEVKVLGGNQADKVGYMGISKSRLLGYRRPQRA